MQIVTTRDSARLHVDVAGSGQDVAFLAGHVLEVAGDVALQGGLEGVTPGLAPLAVNHQGPFPAVTISYNLEEGVLLLTAGTYGNVVRLLPPITIDDALLAPLSLCWKESLSVVRGFVADPAQSCSPVLEALEPI